jgi:hypothetical protein
MKKFVDWLIENQDEKLNRRQLLGRAAAGAAAGVGTFFAGALGAGLAKWAFKEQDVTIMGQKIKEIEGQILQFIQKNNHELNLDIQEYIETAMNHMKPSEYKNKLGGLLGYLQVIDIMEKTESLISSIENSGDRRGIQPLDDSLLELSSSVPDLMEGPIKIKIQQKIRMLTARVRQISRYFRSA